MGEADTRAMPMREEHILNGLEQEVSGLHEQELDCSINWPQLLHGRGSLIHSERKSNTAHVDP